MISLREKLLNKLAPSRPSVITDVDLGPFNFGQVQDLHNLYLHLTRNGFAMKDLALYIGKKKLLMAKEAEKAKQRAKKEEGFTAGERQIMADMSERDRRKFMKRQTDAKRKKRKLRANTQ